MKTDALKQALNLNKFDFAFGGARRDEEKSRSKERIFSFRNRSTFGTLKIKDPSYGVYIILTKKENESIKFSTF